MAVCVSKSMGEFVRQISWWLHQRASRELETHGGKRKEKVEFRISEQKVRSGFCREWVGRARQHNASVGIGKLHWVQI